MMIPESISPKASLTDLYLKAPKIMQIKKRIKLFQYINETIFKQNNQRGETSF